MAKEALASGLHTRCVSVSGSILVADDLDFEVCKDYYLTVEAWDGGDPPLSSATLVTIELMDINDNAPAFSQNIYNVLVSEDASVGQTVTQVPSQSWSWSCCHFPSRCHLIPVALIFHYVSFCFRFQQRTWTAR